MDTPSPTGPDRVIRLARFFSYPKQVIYLFISFIALLSLLHYFSLAQRYIRARRSTRPKSNTGSYIRVPYAIVDSFRVILFRWTVPFPFGYSLNIAEVGLTVAYLAILLTWTFVNTTTVTGIKVEPHYYANRAGTIAASQIPLVTALGMRNNLVSYLTGVSYDKLNYLHRIAFRSLIILIWIHAGGRMTVGLLDDEALTSRWVQCGLLAAISLLVMSILTLRPLRKLSYEIFLIIHFVFALIFLLSVYFHLTGRDLTYYGAWPAMIVWGLDRFIRLIKLALFNVPSHLSRSRSTTKTTNARIQILPGAPNPPSTSTKINAKNSTNTSPNPESFLKITVLIPPTSTTFPFSTLTNLLCKWRPGQSVYISIPSLSPWWPFQAHPFTIANIYRSNQGSVEHEGEGGAVDVEKAHHGSMQTTATTTTNDTELIFFVRVRQGFTKRLFHAVQSTPHLTINTNVVLNGPYSAPPLLVGYERAVLIAGGSGVAFTLPLLLDLIEKSHDPNETGCKRILFIWAVRDASQLSWITPLLHPSLSSLSSSSSSTLELDIRFYITTSPIPSSPSSAASSPDPDSRSITPTPTSPLPPSLAKHSQSGDDERNSNSDVEALHEMPTLPTLVISSSQEPNSASYDTQPSMNFQSFNSDMINIATSRGRPDIKRILQGEINGHDHNEHRNGGESACPGGIISVNVCGPTALIDTTRAALRSPRPWDIMNGGPRVVLHVEAFGGA